MKFFIIYEQEAPHFQFALGPADDVVNPVPQEGLARFYSKKKKSLWAECSVQYFLWFLRNHFLFSILSYPPGFSSWVYARCFTESLMFISCPLIVFLQQPNTALHHLALISCPGLGAFFFCFCSHPEHDPQTAPALLPKATLG